MKVLVIDNNMDRDCWGAEAICRFVRKYPAATLIVRRAPHEDLPASPRAFDRVIISGSKTSALEWHPWVRKLDDFIRETVDSGTPLFGICYGHQSLMRAIGGEDCVSNKTAPEYGWGKIQKVAESPILAGLPDEFTSFQIHSDEVSKLPPGVKLLARSKDCAIQGCEIEGKPAYSIQFHPEKIIEDTVDSWRHVPKKGNILGKSDKLFDPSVGETIFKNFLELGIKK